MLFFWWVLVISAVSLGGSWYARKTGRAQAITAVYVAMVLTAQIAATKIISFHFFHFSISAPAGVVSFSVTFLLIDIVTEYFGRAEALRVIFSALIAQIVSFVVFLFVLAVPSASWWNGQAALASVIGGSFRMALAGWIAFGVSETTDAYLFSFLKKITQGRYVWIRALFSSLPAMAVDSFVFVVLAFWGSAPIGLLIGGQIVAKWVIAVIDVPFMYANRFVLYRVKNCFFCNGLWRTLRHGEGVDNSS